MRQYKKLSVYEKSYKLAKEVYEASKTFPKEEQYGLTSQIRRAATSIPLNIAEGYAKVEGGKELIRYLSMARGSNAEMEVLLEFVFDFGYVKESKYRDFAARYEEVGRMLTGLIKAVRERN